MAKKCMKILIINLNSNAKYEFLAMNNNSSREKSFSYLQFGIFILSYCILLHNNLANHKKTGSKYMIQIISWINFLFVQPVSLFPTFFPVYTKNMVGNNETGCTRRKLE